MRTIRIRLSWDDDFIEQRVRCWCDWPGVLRTIWRYYRRGGKNYDWFGKREVP